MKVHQIQTNNSLQNINYVIEYDSKKAVVIDPYYSEQIIEFAKEHDLQIVGIVNTHEHGDHIQGNFEIKQVFNCRIYAHEIASKSIPNIDILLHEGNKMQLDDNSFLEVIHTPGHTPGHICLKLIEGGKVVGIFTGDTLFNAGVGNCGSGNVEDLYKSIGKVFTEDLSDEILIYPGHDYIENNLRFSRSIEMYNLRILDYLDEYKEKASVGEIPIYRLGDERKINCFLRLNEQGVQETIGKNLSEKEIFLELRRRRDQW